MTGIEVITLTKLTDEHWQKYCDASSEILKLYYPEQIKKKKPWQNFKEEYLDKVERNRENRYNEEVIFYNDKVAGWVDFWFDYSQSYIGFNYNSKTIHQNVLNIILQRIYNFLTEQKLKFVYSGYSDQRRIEPLMQIEAEIEEEFETNKLDRIDMQLEMYNNIINSTNLPEGYKLNIFSELPGHLIDKFIEFENPVIEEINNMNPSDVKIPLAKRSDLERQNSAFKKDGIVFIYYLLLDETENIIAISSVLIDTKNHGVIKHIGSLTAVKNVHRGKGYGRYIKAEIYKMLIEKNKDFKQIITDTMPWNIYMYRINKEFGFKPYKHGYVFKLTKELLEKYLKR
jgi:hypothetical protein